MEGLGYKVDKQVGSAGFKIDLAVRHPDLPGRYMLAVECDGATYHRGLWARERDRLRQEILENMGWRFCRIWSTDWFYRRAEAAQKLRVALESASSTGPIARQPEPLGRPIPDPSKEPVVSTSEANAFDPRMPPYELAKSIPVPLNEEPHQVTIAVLARITQAIVAIEGPVHQDEVARRVTTLFGKSRTGSLISDASFRSLQALKASRTLVERDDFWMTPAQMENPPVRDRSAAPVTLQRANMLSPLEIRAAIKIAERRERHYVGGRSGDSSHSPAGLPADGAGPKGRDTQDDPIVIVSVNDDDIASTLPKGAARWPMQRDRGQCFIQVEAAVIDRMRAMRARALSPAPPRCHKDRDVRGISRRLSQTLTISFIETSMAGSSRSSEESTT